MPDANLKKIWEEYCRRELAGLLPVLSALGFSLEEAQPHIGGERYLMSGRKLVLIGMRTQDGRRAVIKASSNQGGVREIAREREARSALLRLPFAYRMPLSPEELFYGSRSGYTLSITAYLAQERPFLARPLEEQFDLALNAFKAQEGIHAATYAHAKAIRSTFGLWESGEYLHSFRAFRAHVETCASEQTELSGTLNQAETFLKEHADDIERYCGFLTHEDFALMNLRVTGAGVFLIDHASLRFGNKYESWARFLNYMLLYNRPLEQALERYTEDNRAPEEVLALRLMRIYKLGELLQYHARAFAHSEGDLRTLSGERLRFWSRVLATLLENAPLPESVIEAYKRSRDTLRSEEEKRRQRELQQL